MPIVAQGTGWHIESFHVNRASIADQAERVTTHTLQRPGVFIGGSATMDHDLAASAVTGLSLVLRETDDSNLIIGEDVTAVESVFMNDSGAAAVVGEVVVVFIRDHR